MKLTASLMIFCIFTQVVSMEQPPQKALVQHNPASLQGLPSDIKKLLIPLVVSGTLKDMTHGLCSLAATNKWFHAQINELHMMYSILNRLPRICNRIDLIERLRSKPKSLPIFQGVPILAYLVTIKSISLKNGHELVKAILASDQTKINILLHSHNINLNYQNFGVSALRVAIEASDETLVKKLLYAGADPNLESDMDQQRPLMYAAHTQRLIGIKIFRMLLDAGAKVNAQDRVGRTALSYSIQYGNVDAVRILLAAGAFLKKNKTYSFDWARMHLEKRNYQEIAQGIDREEYAYQEIAAILERYERIDESGQRKKAKYDDAYYPGDRFGMHCTIS